MPVPTTFQNISPSDLDDCLEERERDANGGPIDPCRVCDGSWQARNAGWNWDEEATRWVEPAVDWNAHIRPLRINWTMPTFNPTIYTTEGEAPMPTEQYNYCYRCDARVLDSTMTECTTCRDRLCVECSSNHLHLGERCSGCGYRVLSGDTVEWCESHESFYCEYHRTSHRSCGYEEYESEDEGRYSGRPPIQGYGREATLEYMDDEYVEHPLARGQRAAAVELEVEWDEDANPRTLGQPLPRLVLPDSVGITNDGSLSNGIEVTTPPARGLALVNVITTTCDLLYEGGYRIKESCGMHTHIDLRDRMSDKKFLSHLFNAFFAIEDILYAMQGANRHTNHYSIPLRNQYKFFDMYGQKSGDFDYNFYKQPKTVEGKYYVEREKERKYAGVRYAAFNFHSVYYRGSLECRLHEGCVSADDALRWIDLLQSIIARVERGHSYAAMAKLARMNVTKEKVNAFARYFGLSKDQRAYVMGRIDTGQGFGFALAHRINWGVPTKGRPTREPRRATRYVGNRVRCMNCSYEWVMRDSLVYCPSCLRNLFDDYGGLRYTRVTTRRSSRTTSRTRQSATAQSDRLFFSTLISDR